MSTVGGARVEILNTLLPRTWTLYVQVVARSLIGASATRTHALRRVDEELPTVRIAGSPEVALRDPSVPYVFTALGRSSCERSDLMRYSWDVFQEVHTVHGVVHTVV